VRGFILCVFVDPTSFLYVPVSACNYLQVKISFIFHFNFYRLSIFTDCKNFIHFSFQFLQTVKITFQKLFQFFK